MESKKTAILLCLNINSVNSLDAKGIRRLDNFRKRNDVENILISLFTDDESDYDLVDDAMTVMYFSRPYGEIILLSLYGKNFKVMQADDLQGLVNVKFNESIQVQIEDAAQEAEEYYDVKDYFIVNKNEGLDINNNKFSKVTYEDLIEKGKTKNRRKAH